MTKTLYLYSKYANLLENFEEDVGKNQDPFVIIHIGEQVYKTSPHYDGGLNPYWENPMKFDLNGEKEALVRLMDWDGFNDQNEEVSDCIGDVKLDLTKLESLGSGEITESVFLYDKYQGTITFGFKFDDVEANIQDLYLGTTIEGYVLEKFIGGGAFGRVYKSTHKDGNSVAVKRIDIETFNKYRPYIMSEITTMKKFDHPNIIRIIESHFSKEAVYIVMQLCNQGNLKSYMKDRGIDFLKEDEAIFYLKQVALGFRGLHEQNVMHRDFRLDNLLVHEGQIILADLGSAKAVKGVTTIPCGSLVYMAPEVLKSQGYTNKADIWSIGVSFFEVLFGTFPFFGKDKEEILKKIMEGNGTNLKIPYDVNPVSEDCADLLKKMLNFGVKQRIDWGDFFDHPMFDEKDDKGKTNLLGSNVNTMKLIDIQFENIKDEEVPHVFNLTEDLVDNLKNKSKEEIAEEFKTETNAVEEKPDQEFFKNFAVKFQNDNRNGLDECDNKYHFERQKIEFIRRTSCELFVLREMMVKKENNSAFGNAKIMEIINEIGVPSTMLISLAMIKLALNEIDYNIICIKDTSINNFELAGFDEWIGNKKGINMACQYEECKCDINRNRDHFMEHISKITWDEKDKTHIIDNLNEYMDNESL